MSGMKIRGGRVAVMGVLAVIAMLFVAGCVSVQQTVQERQEAIGATTDKVNYLEAKQINEVESWKDQPGKIVNWYLFPPNGQVITLQCKGVPNSSTESLEPNSGSPRASSYGAFLVPVEGVDILTNELAGRDGTFGDPVGFRYCLTVDGQYVDIPAMGMPYLVSSAVFTFAESTVKRDFEAEVRLLQAEELIKAGRCVSPETLQEIPCPAAP